MKAPTHREIAAACGVNSSTVSRALANNPSLPEETRVRIQIQARAMGWRPNPLASAYMAHLRATHPPAWRATLAYVISFPDAKSLKEMPGYHQLHYQGAELRAQTLGYTLEPIWFRELDFQGKSLSRLLKSRGVPGVLFYGQPALEQQLADFEWDSFAVATWGHGYSLPNLRLHHAACHHLHALRMSLQQLRQLGYRNIALILSKDQDLLAGQAFLSSFYYQEKHAEPGETLHSLRLDTPDSTPAQRSKIRKWLETHRPEVVIGEEVVWDAIKEMKWRVPEDIAFASLFCSREWPDIGGIDQCSEIIGAHSVDLVASQLQNNERGIPPTAKLLLTDGRWRDGPSVPARKETHPRKQAKTHHKKNAPPIVG